MIAVSGFACYLAVGVKHIQLGIQPSEVEEEQLLPTGCVSLVLSFVYLFDSVLTVMLSLKEWCGMKIYMSEFEICFTCFRH